MKFPVRRVILALGILLLGALGGCSAKQKEIETSNDLRMIAIAIQDYSDNNHKGPSRVEDLAPYLENDQRLIERIRLGDIVVIWKVSFSDLMKQPGGPSSCVLAYGKDVPEKGGPVVMGDGTVNRMSAEEFKTAKLAEPSKK
jgi:hypothetical protein